MVCLYGRFAWDLAVQGYAKEYKNNLIQKLGKSLTEECPEIRLGTYSAGYPLKNVRVCLSVCG